MRYLALATDYDGTLASDGRVAEAAWAAVARLRDSGRKLILVTGRELEDLKKVCPHLDRFDRVVAENGALLYRPAGGEEAVLAPPPPSAFVQALRDRGVVHLGVGRAVLASVRPYETIILQTIRDMGLELQIIFNKDAVMVLPPGVNKATGLTAALDELGLSPHNVVGVGDAENDHAFLRECECAAAVANALPTLKQEADVVTTRERGGGVAELIDEVLADDLRRRRLGRRDVLLGRRVDGEEVGLAPYGTVALAAGPSGGGKSSVTTGLLERLAAAGYQFCVIDPEGDYDALQGAVVLGDPQRTPDAAEVMRLLARPTGNVIVNLLSLPMADRPLFCAGLLPRLQELRVKTGRPHWLVFDEAHHLFPADWRPASESLPQDLQTALLITVHPEQVSAAVLRNVNTVLAVGAGPERTLAAFAKAVGAADPRAAPAKLRRGEVMVWRPEGGEPFVVAAEPGRTERRRHTRKYAEGLLVPERSFYFRGPEGKLNLRAHNLVLFLELADGVDDETWLYHLHQGDYSRWFREEIGDDGLADEAAAVESRPALSAADGRAAVRAAVSRRYTQPENPSLPKM